MATGVLLEVDDTRLHVVERGEGLPLFVLHGGPGLDHTMFGHHLDALTDQVRLILVDQRSQGRSDPAPLATVTLSRMARDISALAAAMGLKRYAVLGHSFGAFVALQHAVDVPGAAAATIISSGLPSERSSSASRMSSTGSSRPNFASKSSSHGPTSNGSKPRRDARRYCATSCRSISPTRTIPASPR